MLWQGTELLGNRCQLHLWPYRPTVTHTEAMSSTSSPLRLFPTEASARKAGLHLADLRGERLSTVLYALLPEGEKKATYLLSSSYRLTVPERRWAEEHRASITKLGRFPLGAGFLPLQTRMVRDVKPTDPQPNE